MILNLKKIKYNVRKKNGKGGGGGSARSCNLDGQLLVSKKCPVLEERLQLVNVFGDSGGGSVRDRGIKNFKCLGVLGCKNLSRHFCFNFSLVPGVCMRLYIVGIFMRSTLWSRKYFNVLAVISSLPPV